jgi:K+-sensing histidine kinase KdpD
MPWLLVCINASTFSERLIRIGQRMAADQDAEWFAVYVESPQDTSFTQSARDQLARNLTLARELGAKVQVLSAQNIAGEIIAFSREHNITVIMILLLPVIYSGMTWGRRSGLITSLMAVAALDFFFVPPRMTLAFEDLRYLPMFIVFVIVGIITSFLADLVRWQGESARQRERFVSNL